MLRNYFTTLLRNFWRQKEYSMLNLLGLSLGMAACIIILVYVTNEFSYDRYHSKEERIYRITQKQKTEKTLAWVGGGMAPMVREEFQEFEKVGSISNTSAIVSRLDTDNEISFKENKLFYTEPEILQIFDVAFIEGTSADALNKSGEVILTERTAKKYFKDQNAIGKHMKVGKSDVTVTGVIKDFPANSHIHPEILISMATFKTEYGFSLSDQFSSYWWPFTWTYVLLKEGQSAQSINDRLATIIKKYRQEPEASNFIPELQPLKDIHFGDLISEAEANGNLRLVYVFISIAFFLLLLACVNFMNLATARALKRSKEVGVRKAIGARKSQLVFQFLSEAFVLSGGALAISLVFAEMVLPFFNQQLGLQLTIPYTSAFLWCSLIGLVLSAALLAGFYPAFFLSSFNAASVLKSSASTQIGGAHVRKILVVFQFAISITLIIFSTIAYYQINYLRNAHLGFDKEHILVIDQLGATTGYEAVRDKLEKLASVKLAAGSNARPGIDQGWGPYTFETTGINAANNQTIGQQLVSHDFFDLLGLEIVAGRKFDKKSNADAGRMYLMRDRFPAYDGRNYIINEAAAKLIGKTPEEALGMPMRIFTEENGLLFSDFKGSIVGVVKDYHATSLREEIKPTAYLLGNENYYGAIIVKLQSGNITNHVAAIEKIWKEVNPTIPIQYSFLNEDIDKQYQAEKRLGIIIATFSGMVLFVACLGLFGLSAYTAELKTKEIGIRKVLGASITNIINMLSKEFLMLLLIASAIAVPVGWYSAKIWLDDFAYRVDMSLWFFVGAGLLCIVIALLTIAWQSIRAAISNPVESLRSE